MLDLAGFTVFSREVELEHAVAHRGPEAIRVDRVRHAKEVLLQGAPARDFTYRVPVDPPLTGRALAVLIGTRIYIVTGITARLADDHPEIERFFASFRLWNEGEKPGGADKNAAPENRSRSWG